MASRPLLSAAAARWARGQSRGRTARAARASAICVLLALGGSPVPVPAQVAADTAAALRQRAEELRQKQRLPDALVVYQRLVMADPDNFEDRFWIAKLEGWTGHPAAAESLFTNLLDERPEHYDSRIGLADVRVWLKQYAAAQADLEALNRTYPNDPEVLLRLGQVREASGDLREARRYLTQALQASPDHAGAKQALRRLARKSHWEAGVEYYGEQVSRLPAANGTTASLEARPGNHLRWRAGVTVQDKFDRTETRFGAELGHRLWPSTQLEWAAYVAPGAEVMPRQAYGLTVGQKVGRGLVVYGDYALLDFTDAVVHQVGPHVELYAGAHWLLTGRYGYSSTRFTGTAGAVGNHSGSVSIGYLYHEANRVRVFAGAGAESFALPSRDVIGRFQASTIGVEWRHFVTPRLGIVLHYAHQDRSNTDRAEAYSLGLVQRW